MDVAACPRSCCGVLLCVSDSHRAALPGLLPSYVSSWWQAALWYGSGVLLLLMLRCDSLACWMAFMGACMLETACHGVLAAWGVSL